MKTDLQSFIGVIKAKTGIELSVCSFDDANITLLEELSNGQVISDTQNNRTLFRVEDKNKEYVCSIEGATEHEKRYALLISQLATDFFRQENQLDKEDFYRSVLLGEMSFSDIAQYAQKFSIKNLPCTVMVVPSDSEEVFDVIYNYCEDGIDYALRIEKDIVVIKYYSEKEEYRSGTEYAEYIAQSVLEEAGKEIKVYIGGIVKSINDLHVSFEQAETAARLSESFCSKGSVHSFREFLSVKMIEDLPKQKINDYLSTMYDDTAKEVFEDKELVNTAEEFLENSLNLSETARKIFLHRNTLTYRLDKIEKATGLNIRKFSDAVTFRLIIHILKLTK